MLGTSSNLGKATDGSLRDKGSLSEAMAGRLADEILAGRIASGSRLPPVEELARSFEVSRTVVREALSLLKSEGLVTVRHGRGVYVTDDPRMRPLRIDPANVSTVRDVLAILQVRLGLEVEAAGLAAVNRTESDIAAMSDALRRFDKALREGRQAAEEDRQFHAAIAVASGNPYLPRFLEFLGHHIIPRQRLLYMDRKPADLRRYVEKLQNEHRRIERAIAEGDAQLARMTMRSHLENGVHRAREYQEMMLARGAAARTSP